MGTREIIGWMGCNNGDPQWRLEVKRDPAHPDRLLSAVFCNPVKDDGSCKQKGDRSFYSVEARADTPFGAPTVVQEQDYAVGVPTGVEYRRRTYDRSGKFTGWEMAPPAELLIVGIVIKSGDDFVLRASFSNLRVFKGLMPPVINDDGTIEHEGRTWHLQNLRHPDWQRFDPNRFAAVFGPDRPDFVEIMELFDF